jgi:hypothetical protein
MATLIAFPILGAALMLQSAILSRVTLLQGPADLILVTLVSWTMHERVETTWEWAILAGLFVAWISALPVWVAPASYLLTAGLALLLRNQVWQIPVLALFTAIIAGTLVTHSISFLALRLEGAPINLGEAFNLITLPSLLLNLLLAIPVNALITEVAQWLYPPEMET